jgi:hypothetical protein
MALSKYARQERAKIIAALEGLGAPGDWLEELRKSEQVVVHQIMSPSPYRSFRPPDRDRYEETLEEWKERALAQHRSALEDQAEEWQAWERTGIDGPVAQPKRRRRTDSTPEDRIRWAAEWLLGRTWEDIAGQYLQPAGSAQELQKATNRVRQSATEILRIAGFDKSNRLRKTRE